ncbi:NADPH-dependent oxidoreductase [Candidatus Saccharibacteria bacterium]|nr:MAG: NADPH-dependent oxidoreductase [Candidatus Saccharibacteria bacterium]
MKLQVIIGSTRPGRQSDKLARWVSTHAADIEGVEVELVDLVDYPLALFDEAISPQYNPNRSPSAAAKKWLDKLSEADAYVLVTPEYNRSTSGVLKNALDYVDFQMKDKPVGIVAHGSSGGGQAVGHLRAIVTGVLAVTIPQAVYFAHRVSEVVSEKGEITEELAQKPGGPKSALDGMLASLKWYSDALQSARD